MNKKLFTLCAILLLATACTKKNTVSTTLHILDADGNIGVSIGTVSFTDTEKGLEITTDLKNLPAGEHGFHIHENPSCEPLEKDGKIVPALQAGGHYDPQKTNTHEGPLGNGHLGDLPLLTVSQAGDVKTTLYAPRLKVQDIKNRAVMIHVGGDTYSDTPTLGGGGSRMACGVTK